MNADKKNELEHKSLSLEYKFDAEQGVVTGHVAVFNNVDDNNDIIRAGAFTKSIAKFTPPIVWQHNIKEAIGKPVILKEDNKGLYVEAKLTKGVPEADKALLLLKDKVIDSFSFGYIVTDFEYEDGIRIIKELDLFEISLVTLPCNKQAKVIDVKQKEATPENAPIDIEEIKSIRDAERFLIKNKKSLTREYITGIVSKIKDFSIKENEEKKNNSEMLEVLNSLKKVEKLYE